jgi:predicted RNase H-like HicB family nuclease
VTGQHWCSRYGDWPAAAGDTWAVTRDEYLRVPYVLVLESLQDPATGERLERAYYPELPGAWAEATSAVDARDLADERRVTVILDRLEHGRPIPVPRPPRPLAAVHWLEAPGFHEGFSGVCVVARGLLG